MTRRPISMNKKTEIFRLKALGLKERAIARALGASRKTVRKFLQEKELKSFNVCDENRPPKLDSFSWDEIAREFREKDVPLNILWMELKEAKKIDWSYSYFWKQFQRNCPSTKELTMIREHLSGERAEIDYCDGIDILDLATGEVTKTHLFVGVLCRSRYTYAEFSYSQKSTDFLNSHVRMFQFFAGVPRQLSPDNLKSAVSKAHKYDPDINQAYQRLAHHYGIAVVPARVKSPKDKAIVERTIQIFQKWFFKMVRHRTFTSLMELNKSLHEYLVEFNNKKHRILGCSRGEAFEIEKKDLGQLPEVEFTVRTHKRCILHHDCHIQFEFNFYSAPWEYREKVLDIWISERTLEIFHEGKLIAQHTKSRAKNKFVTNKDHYPSSHKAYLEITPQYLLKKSKEAGKDVAALIESLFSDPYPLKYLRRAQGIVALIKKYPENQLNYACKQALLLERPFLRFVEAIAKMPLPIESIPPERTFNPYLRKTELLKTENLPVTISSQMSAQLTLSKGGKSWTSPTIN